ncbi:MAG: hypothetical protein FJW88_14795 [Actinobacteria bacterium]|nr:hypothetical protein [Actinomycetota bacterium]
MRWRQRGGRARAPPRRAPPRRAPPRRARPPPPRCRCPRPRVRSGSYGPSPATSRPSRSSPPGAGSCSPRT